MLPPTIPENVVAAVEFKVNVYPPSTVEPTVKAALPVFKIQLAYKTTAVPTVIASLDV